MARPVATTRFAWLAAAVAALAGLVFVAFAPALDNQLLRTWDTHQYVIENPHIRALGAENLLWMLTAFHVSNWHPLTWFSHAVDYALFGLDPFGHHLVNVAFHALNTLLVFVFGAMLLQRVPAASGAGGASGDRADTWPWVSAFIAAALFGVHPQHVESVAWVAERKDVLCLFFSLLAMICYLRFGSATGKGRRHWYAAVLLFFVLALLSKPMAVTLPVVLLLLDVYPLGRLGPGGGRGHGESAARLVIEKIPLFALSAATALVTWLAQQGGGSVASLAARGLDERMLNAFNSLIFYLSKLALPLGFSPFYAWPPTTDATVTVLQVIPILACALITALALFAWRKGRRHWLIAWLFYLVTLLPVLGIVQVGNQAAADRYAYWPTLPFYLLAGAFFGAVITRAATGRGSRLATVAGLFIALAVLTGLTREQSDVWQDDVRLWGHAVAFDPGNAYLRFRLGDAYASHGLPGPAVNAYRSALAIEPGYLWYGINLPRALLDLERYEEALLQVDRLIQGDVTGGHGVDRLLFRRAQALAGLGREDEARADLHEALRINPGNAQAAEMLATLAR